jgi:peptidoglycan/LPS O-acetylase OafA/YrhL
MVAALALLLAAAFGAADQYLGSLPGAHVWAAHIAWATDVSLLSAPWLLVPFLAGYTQREPRRAAVLGLACTLSALTGYALMTLSPVEHAELTLHSLGGFAWSSDRVLVGALVTGPLFGWLGHRWRVERDWIAPLIVAGAFCLEPLAHVAVGQAIRFRSVWVAKVCVGLAMVLYVVLANRTGRARAV